MANAGDVCSPATKLADSRFRRRWDLTHPERYAARSTTQDEDQRERCERHRSASQHDHYACYRFSLNRHGLHPAGEITGDHLSNGQRQGQYDQKSTLRPRLLVLPVKLDARLCSRAGGSRVTLHAIGPRLPPSHRHLAARAYRGARPLSS
jgi:hypothetical protein